MLKELSENTPSPCGSYDLNLGATGQSKGAFFWKFFQHLHRLPRQPAKK